MKHELAAFAAQILSLLLNAALFALVAWARKKLSDATENRRLSDAIDLLSRGASAVVADMEQHVVRDLKDPNKPGTWDEVAKRAVRETAVLRLKSLYPRAVREVESANPQKVAETLGTLIEAAVLKYKKP